MERDLLAHLADKFVTQREDLATEALLYVLKRSPAARHQVGVLLTDLGITVEGSLEFESQSVGTDQERPDLACIIGGQERVLFEMKFWAGLTAQQPVGYLERLTESDGLALVFVAPSIRLETLWSELTRRIMAEGYTLSLAPTDLKGVYSAEVAGVRLSLLSWDLLLTSIDGALLSTGEISLRESLGQLQALCKREDVDAFLPLEAHELTNNSARRIEQFGHLVDDAVERLSAEGIMDGTGLRTAASNGWYGRYVRLCEAGCLFYFSAYNWARRAATPIWIRVKDRNWERSPALLSALEAAQSQGKLEYFIPGSMRKGQGSGVEIPIWLPLGKERDEVLSAVLEQLRTLGDVIQNAELPPLRDLESKPEV